jgi:hypothetical protein
MIEPLCEEPPQLDGIPLSLTQAVEGSPIDERFQERMAQQVMHRIVFAMDLSRRMPNAYRKDHVLTGNYSQDARAILINAWRSSSAAYWAHHFGPLYCEETA